ncbi:hypothetical protein CANARDRAFT_188371, partial [[Candida] arabinofermentans NRRL YB-2248]
IKKSKTCFELTNSSSIGTVRSFDNIESLGSTCITSSILLTLERWFDDLSLDSSSYLKLKLNGDIMLSSIIKNLDKSSVEVNRLSDYVASQLLKKLVGGCVKDFGFNGILYPLCDIFHSVLLKDYPLISKSKNTNNGQADSHSHLQPILASTDSLQSSDSLITVIIRFNSKELKFIFPSNSCSPPTLLELITNSKSAFSIVNNNRVIKIRNKETGAIINSDFELERLFSLTRNKFGKLIELELIHPNVQDYLNLNYDSTPP